MSVLCLALLHVAAAAAMSVPLDQTNSTLRQSKGVLHCYCNLPECITTGYMCKSQSLGCFSDLDPYLGIERTPHGCIDLLPEKRQGECNKMPNLRSILICCQEDMCNHVDSPETWHKYNETIFATAALIGGRSEKMMVERGNYRSQEVWFKVATIAVPICGALILLMLVVLAVRMLRNDSLDETVLAAKLRNKQCFPVMNASMQSSMGNPACGGTQEKKLPLLLQQNDTRVKCLQEKNVANAKLNCLPGGGVLLDFDKRSDPSECNLYRGVASPLLADKLDYKRPRDWPDTV